MTDPLRARTPEQQRLYRLLEVAGMLKESPTSGLLVPDCRRLALLTLERTGEELPDQATRGPLTRGIPVQLNHARILADTFDVDLRTLAYDEVPTGRGLRPPRLREILGMR